MIRQGIVVVGIYLEDDQEGGKEGVEKPHCSGAEVPEVREESGGRSQKSEELVASRDSCRDALLNPRGPALPSAGAATALCFLAP